jgi:hypothetical protein
MAGIYKHKRGDTFSMSGTVSATDGGVAVTDFTGWTGASQVRDENGDKVADLTFAWVDPTAKTMTLTYAATTSWPVGNVFLDIQLTTPAGDIISTGTTRFAVIEDITR